MKLLIILSVVAFGYSDKLDRTYLPPPNAGTAGGSPGSLIAPGAPTSFGQGLPSSSSPLSGSSNFAASSFNQGSTNGPLESGPGFESSGFGQPSGTSFGSNIGQSPIFSGQQSGLNGAQSFAQDGSEGTQNKPGVGQQTNFGVSNAGDLQGNAFGSIKGPGAPSFGAASRPSGSNAFGSPQEGFGLGQANAYAAPQPERPQAAADRNAEILKYINENNGESYNYSYETSNGISAEETGVATNGVKAQGGFAYTGDDGNRYSLTYTADENGFQPQGEHLPTPHPIPEEILKSIEENARAAAAGTQEGAYRPEEYESENSVQQYNAGVTAYSQPQGQNINSLQGQEGNQPQSSMYPTNQDISSKGQLSGPSSSNSQIQSNQASNRFSSGANGIKGQNGQYQQRFGSNSQGVAQSSSGQNIGHNVQGVQNNGYKYSQPQNGFGSQANQRPSAQTGPQIDAQKPNSYSSTLAQVSGSNDRGIFGSNRPTGDASIQSNQIQAGFSNESPQQGQQPSFGSNELSFGSNQLSFGSKKEQQPSFGSSESLSGAASISKQGQQPTFGSNQQSLGSNQPSFGSNQPSFGSNQPSFGFKQEQQPSFGPIQSLSSAASTSKQGQQPTFGSNQPSYVSNQPSYGSNQPSFGSKEEQQPSFGSNQPSFGSKQEQQPSFGSSQSLSGAASISKQGQQPTFGSNQPSFGYPGNPNQGQQTQFGSSQSSFGSNQPSLASGQSSQSQQQTFGSAGSSDKGYQYGLNANQPAFNSGNDIRQGSQFGNKPSSPNVGFGQGLPFAPEVQGGSSNAARPQYQQNRNQPSFGSNTPSQGPQFGANGQVGQNAAGMSASRGSQPNGQPQYNQPGQQSLFGPSGPQSNGGLSSGASGSEFGGPRQPPSFSPQEGYTY